MCVLLVQKYINYCTKSIPDIKMKDFCDMNLPKIHLIARDILTFNW